MSGEPASDDSVVTVGADSSNDIQVDGVFPFHARIRCREDGCLVEDLTHDQVGSPQTFLVPAANPSMRLPVSEPCQAIYDDWLYLGTRRFDLSRLRSPQLAAGTTVEDTSEVSQVPEGGITVRVGGNPSNRVVVTSPSVSDVHAELRIVNGQCWVRDCGSRNGSYWIDPQSPTLLHPVSNSGWTPVDVNCALVLGSYRLPLASLREIQDIPFREGRHVDIGRAKQNHRVFERVAVSSRHARISFREGRALVEDRDSVGGTFLNGARLAPFKPRALRQADKVRIGAYELRLDPSVPNQIRVDYQDSVTLDVDSLGVELGGREVLRQVSFSAQPGELVGILGPSGHGKSLLLESLLQRPNLRSAGTVRFNGVDVTGILESARQQTGFVPQGEVLPWHLTAGQVLEYSARLWIRSDLSADEIAGQIDQVLSRLDVSGIRDKPVRVLSGGEARRLSIAHELIRSPRLMLLDEPTTGLSTKDARVVMRSLRALADEGHTVVSVVHQPSRDVFSMFNAVAVVFHGRLLYFGPPQFSNPYFGSEGSHPEEIFTVLEEYERQLEDHAHAEQLLDGLERRFHESREYQEYVASRLSRRAANPGASKEHG